MSIENYKVEYDTLINAVGIMIEYEDEVGRGWISDTLSSDDAIDLGKQLTEAGNKLKWKEASMSESYYERFRMALEKAVIARQNELIIKWHHELMEQLNK